MSKYEGGDHYLDPETGVLKNKLGIEDEDELKEAEAASAGWRSFQLSEKPIQGRFDLDHLKAIHKHLFSDVYEWAGELRDIDLAKGNSYFANHAHIVGAARLVFEKLAEEGYLNGLDAAAFSERAAYYLGEINALHPFREGNGRVQREFINHLANRNGYFIEWKNINQKDMIHASIGSFHHGDNTKYAAFIRDNLRKFPAEQPQHEQSQGAIFVLMVEERAPGKPCGKPEKLTDFVNTVPLAAKPPARAFTAAEISRDRKTRSAHYAQLAADQQRGEALEHMREDMKAGRNLSAGDVRHLSRDDLEKIKTKGDDHLKQIVQQHEREREQERER